MQDLDLQGKLVYLTVHFQNWLQELNINFSVPVIGRLAKVTKVIDWESKEGKLVLSERQKSPKWKNLDPKSFKFIISIYYPELIVKNKKGVIIPEVVPMMNPYNGKGPFFELVPDWMLKDIISEAGKVSIVTREEAASLGIKNKIRRDGKN